MKNEVQLIAYVDRIGCKNIQGLQLLLKNELKDLFGGVHILPFFYPIDGEDAGFDPIDHKQVDPRLGTWHDVKELSTTLSIMADMIVNHISADSVAFQDFLEKGGGSEYASLFLTYDRVFPSGASEAELEKIYRPRTGLPFTEFRFADGSQQSIWTTFTSKQVDIDVCSEAGQHYLEAILGIYQKAGITMIRLDAAGYAIKKAGTSCFMIPETFDFIDRLTQKARKLGIEVLVEVHSFYKTQIEIAKKVDYVYDFALPVLVLDTLFNQNAKNLKKWLGIAPKNVITVLDTHDGIGIVDVASEGGEPGLVPDDALHEIVETIHANSEGRSRKATGAAASNLDLYQVNCTYFEALGKDEKAYIMARAIQFFVPGIPQVYYMGLFGDDNDMELLAKTNVGRDINRHYYSREEILEKSKESVFIHLKELLKIRNGHPAFNGIFELVDTENNRLWIKWSNDGAWIQLEMDLEEKSFVVRGTKNGDQQTLVRL